MAPIFDTHVHYDDDAFAEDRNEVLDSGRIQKILLCHYG